METWDLEDDEVGKVRRPTPLKVKRDKDGGHPLIVGMPSIPVLGRALLLHTQIAVGIPVILTTGLILFHSGSLPEIIVGSIPAVFLVALWRYIRVLKRRKKQLESHFPPNPSEVIPDPDLLWHLLAPTILIPLALLIGSTLSIWFGNRFLATFIPALATFFAFLKYGTRPIEFYYEYLLCHSELPPEYRKTKPEKDGQPHMNVLGCFLVGIVSVPILVSNSAAIFLAAGFIGWFLYARAERLRRNNSWSIVPYFISQSYRVVRTYVDYPDVYDTPRASDVHDQWTPRATRLERSIIFYGLLGALYTSLILGLTYYCPWDVFARLFTSLPESASSSRPELMSQYSWLFAPFLYLFYGSPLAAYLFCFAIAVVLFLLLPPAVLLAIYYPRLFELEELHQELKWNRKHIAK